MLIGSLAQPSVAKSNFYLNQRIKLNRTGGPYGQVHKEIKLWLIDKQQDMVLDRLVL
jgi:hypothetical protein